MKKSGTSCWRDKFSHIYAEEKALSYPTAKRVLELLPESRLIQVEDYKRVFNRPKQCFRSQKKSQKIILAVKKPPYIYAGSEQCQKYGNDNIYYVTPVLNCLYDCDYCYLQGRYDSANIVVFVNNEDIIESVKDAVDARNDKVNPIYVSISYDTDLMLFEKLTGYCGEWIDFASTEPNVIIELRTKSRAFAEIEKYDPTGNVILAWTISPKTIARKYEKAAPSIDSRLESARRAIRGGWSVRLCFDPVIPVGNWKSEYLELVKYVFAKIPADQVRDVAIGTFRMNEEQFKRSKKMRNDCDIYSADIGNRDKEAMQLLERALREYLPEKKIHSI